MKTATRLLTGLLMGLYLSVSAWAMRPDGPVAPSSLTCPATSPPVLQSNRAVICRGESTELTATGCEGTLIWSTGETGASIRVSPHQTTRYTAVCRLPDGPVGQCYSCFAEAFTVTVATPEPPQLATSAPVVCAGDAVTLTATYTGTLEWTDPALSGANPVVTIDQTTTFGATAVQNGCRSNPAKSLTVGTATPNVPALSLLNNPTALCVGQTVTLVAEGCAGQVRWSDGQTGATRTIAVGSTLRYRAVCRLGNSPSSCQSDSSAVLRLPVVAAQARPALQTVVRNTCPYQTADLTRVLNGAFDPALTYEFRTGPTPDAPLVQSVGAVLAGTYWAFARTREGCLSEPVAISANVTPCANGIAPCLSNPPAITIRIDTLDQRRGLVCLAARLRGSATDPRWQCTGTGLLSQQQPLRPRYVASEDDRQRGTLTFTATTPDPDAEGPCTGALAKLTVAISTSATAPTNPDSTNVPDPNVPEAGLVFIPEGFSPNDDGINDRFVIRGVTEGAAISLEVFNRWGHRVFANTNYQNDWDGTANEGVRAGATQAPLPDGTYFYVVRISDGREYVRFLTISR